MKLMESIQKTKNLVHKTVENLKSFFFVGYQKLPKLPLPDPLSCTGGCTKKHQKDRFYDDFCRDWEADLEEAKMRKKNDGMILKEPMKEEDEHSGNLIKFADNNPSKNKRLNGGKEEKKKVGRSQLSKGEEQYYYKRSNGGGYALAQKMRELEMMDVGDMEHVLDVEEALHYYSRLKSPEYLSIVDKFFMDMYSEFSVPHASASINSSKRRLGSLRF
ncbi:hypothetical protein PTKIN_Ptkin18bG0056300 [Pterospermum kingtungense]